MKVDPTASCMQNFHSWPKYFDSFKYFFFSLKTIVEWAGETVLTLHAANFDLSLGKPSDVLASLVSVSEHRARSK